VVYSCSSKRRKGQYGERGSVQPQLTHTTLGLEARMMRGRSKHGASGSTHAIHKSGIHHPGLQTNSGT
jgi:hypothetical protein